MVSTSGGDQIFDPEVVWLEPGGTVTFVLESGTHSATAYAEANDKPSRIPDGAEAFDSGILTEQGAEFQHTFETEGVYDYFCLPHEALGMIGTVVVGSPSPDGQPGLAPPQDSLPGDAPGAIERLNETVRGQL
jgi:plastocyanin